MATHKKGTDTGFKDANGVPILVGDRLRDTETGVIGHIDKYMLFSSPFGFRSQLRRMSMANYVHYEGPEPEAPSGEALTSEEVGSLAPPKGKGLTVLSAKDYIEGKPAGPVDISLKGYATEALVMELSRRGYKIQLVFAKS